MATNDDIYEGLRCIEWSFKRNLEPDWDYRNKEWSKNYDIDGQCTNKARPGFFFCGRCVAYYGGLNERRIPHKG